MISRSSRRISRSIKIFWSTFSSNISDRKTNSAFYTRTINHFQAIINGDHDGTNNTSECINSASAGNSIKMEIHKSVSKQSNYRTIQQCPGHCAKIRMNDRRRENEPIHVHFPKFRHYLILLDLFEIKSNVSYLIS